ncbi:MAG: hypothetical protein QXP36_06820 [Conexivisphaerales archaeon]
MLIGKNMRLAAITATASIALILLNAVLGENDVTVMISLYFLLFLAIGLSLSMRPDHEITKKVVLTRKDEMLLTVKRAADGESEARRYILENLKQLASAKGKAESLLNADEIRRLSSKKRFIKIKDSEERKLYLVTLEKLLDKMADERYS